MERSEGSIDREEPGQVRQAPHTPAGRPVQEGQTLEEIRQFFLPRTLPPVPRPSVDWNRIRRIAYV